MKIEAQHCIASKPETW